MRVKTLETQIEPTAELTLSDFMSPEEAERKTWNEAGCDWAYFIVRFLQFRRRLDIQPEEIVKTRLYERANEMERHALRLVCESEKGFHPSPDDERRLREKDNWLDEYLSGRNIGHADLVQRLNVIPAQVAEREQFDRTYFTKVYDQPRLFSWLLEGKCDEHG